MKQKKRWRPLQGKIRRRAAVVHTRATIRHRRARRCLRLEERDEGIVLVPRVLHGQPTRSTRRPWQRVRRKTFLPRRTLKGPNEFTRSLSMTSTLLPVRRPRWKGPCYPQSARKAMRVVRATAGAVTTDILNEASLTQQNVRSRGKRRRKITEETR